MRKTIRRICAIGLLSVTAAFLAGFAVGAAETVANTLEVIAR